MVVDVVVVIGVFALFAPLTSISINLTPTTTTNHHHDLPPSQNAPPAHSPPIQPRPPTKTHSNPTPHPKLRPPPRTPLRPRSTIRLPNKPGMDADIPNLRDCSRRSYGGDIQLPEIIIECGEQYVVCASDVEYRAGDSGGADIFCE